MKGGGVSSTIESPKRHRAMVSKSVGMHHLASLFSIFSLQVKISYQNAISYCTRKCPCFHISIFSYSSKSFQIPQECMLLDT